MRIAVLLWLGWCLAFGLARADWADLSRYDGLAELAVADGDIRLSLRWKETGLPPGAGQPAADAVPPWLAERLPGLSADGRDLAAKLLAWQHIKADASAPGKPGYYEASLAYPLAQPPHSITIAPPASLAAGLVVLHRGVPVADLVPLQKPLQLTLEADPWRSHFDDPQLIRRHAAPRSYLYVEPYEIRHELLLRLADLKPWLELGLKDPRYVEEAEREAVKHKIGAFLLGRNPVSLDGQPASPQLDRVEFVSFQRGGVLPVAAAGRLDTDTALVGVALAYLSDQPAKTVALHWDLFGAQDASRPVSLIQGRETFDGYVTPGQPEYAWSQDEAMEPVTAAEEPKPPATQLTPDAASPPAFRALPLAGFGLALLAALLPPPWLKHRSGGALLGVLLVVAAAKAFHPRPAALADGGETARRAGLDEAQIKTLLQTLLHNAYRAFPLRDEEKAYGRLAQSLDGELLDEIYLQQRRALLRLAEGLGGEGKVERVEVLDSQPMAWDLASGAWQVDARWLAHGSVSHWGHAHERHNLYQARLSLRPVDGQWRIVGLRFTGGQRLGTGTAS